MTLPAYDGRVGSAAPHASDTLAHALTAVLSDASDEAVPPSGGCLAVRYPGGDAAAVAGARQLFTDAGRLADPLPMTWDTALDLGSVTKVVATTTAVMQLVERGAIRLDDPVRRYVSAAPVDVPLADLLLHRAGLWEWWPFYVSSGGQADVIDAACRRAPRYPPGARHYSDLGFLLLGSVVERVGALALDAAVRELVLEPFGLAATRFARPAGDGPVVATSRGDWVERRMIETRSPYPVPVQASSFTGWRAHVLVGEVNDGNAFHGCGGVAGHAGLFGTVPDLLDYGAALLASLAGNGPLQPGTVRRFIADGPDPGQTLGFRSWASTVAGCTTRVVGHPGFPGVVLGIVPDHDAVVVLAVNRLHIDGGEPMPTEFAWQRALHAAHSLLHERDAG